MRYALRDVPPNAMGQGPLKLFGIIPLSAKDSRDFRRIWRERNETAKRLMNLIGEKNDHDCRADDPQDACVGCLEIERERDQRDLENL